MTDERQTSVRDQILADPSLILEDRELMRALVAADGRGVGRNVVDLRGVLVDRLEERLDRLEDTHREVLAAAYDNVAGTNQVHRACLSLLEAADLASFLTLLTRDVARILAVDAIRLGLEVPEAEPGAGLGPDGPLRQTVVALPEGGAAAYATGGRAIGPRAVTLRRLRAASPDLYGELAPRIRSEAVAMLDLGPERRPAILVMGALGADRFDPDHGVDLLAFFGGILGRSLRRWLT